MNHEVVTAICSAGVSPAGVHYYEPNVPMRAGASMKHHDDYFCARNCSHIHSFILGHASASEPLALQISVCGSKNVN